MYKLEIKSTGRIFETDQVKTNKEGEKLFFDNDYIWFNESLVTILEEPKETKAKTK